MNIFEELRKSKLKYTNDLEQSWTVADLVKKFKEIAPELNIDRNKINRIENNSQKPDVNTLIAYSKIFNVSTDYLLGLSKEKTIDENAKMVSKYTGLSGESIKIIVNLSKDDKLILDTMIKRYGLLLSIADIRRLIAFRSLQPHITVIFDEKTKHEKGHSIDKELTDTINDSSALHFFNEKITSTLKNIIENTIQDSSLGEYFKQLYLTSKIKGRPLTAADLPKLGNIKKKKE